MFIRVDGVSRDYARGTAHAGTPHLAALEAISLQAERGSMLALVGASGSGKTTLLRCIAGLERPDSGEIAIGDRIVFSHQGGIDVPAGERGLAMIFQSYALWPHMRVADNVAYPLRRRRMAAEEVQARVGRYLALVGCEALGQRYPHELSGGQQQRIALARALVYEPALVLFDEPLSNLDAALRLHLRAQIRELQRAVGFTGVYVTHDQQEAFYLGDRVAILDHGRLAQFAAPDEIYRQPATAQVAHFVGADNQAAGWLRENGRLFVGDAVGPIPLANGAAGPPGLPERRATLAVRPESVKLAPPAEGALRGRVTGRALTGALWEYAVELPGGARWRALVPAEAGTFAAGQEVSLELAPHALMVFDEAPAERLQ